MRALLDDVLGAFGVLTRLPVPRREAHVAMRSRSVWAYPLVGAVVGALSALVWFAAQFAGLGTPLAAGLAITAQVLITGALHEDGLADFADGFGGARDKDATLAIMRDSRIGAYGVIALILVLGLRWGAAAGLALHNVLAGLICAALLGRLAIVALLALLAPARGDGFGRVVAHPPRRAGLAALLLGLALVGVQMPPIPAALAFGAAAGVAGSVAMLAKRRIGGYTGDVLGAGEQLAETAALLVFAAAA